MRKYLSFLLALLLLAGCTPEGEEKLKINSNKEGKTVEEITLTKAPTAIPTFTPEPTQVPTPTPEPLHLTREEVEKYKNCVWFPEGFLAPEYLVVTHPDGTISAGLLYDLFTVESWKDIVFISAATSHVAGLKSDGTVVAAGDNSQGQLNVQDWTDITAIATGDYFTAGLHSDGTVVVAGDDYYSKYNLAEVTSSWTDIVAIDADATLLLGLRQEGTVVCNNSFDYNLEDWTDIVSITANSSIPMGVRKNGTVAIAVIKDYIEENSRALIEDIIKWTDIEKVFFSNYGLAFGLQANGTVLVAGENISSQTESLKGLCGLANDWALQEDGTLCNIFNSNPHGSSTNGMLEILRTEGIKQIAESACFFYALLENGSVLVGGYSNDVVETINNKWQNLKSISNSYRYIYGITKDGNLVDVYNSIGQVYNVASVHEGGAGLAILCEDGTVLFKYSPSGNGNSMDGNDVYYDVSDWKNISQVLVGGDYILGLTSDGSVVVTGQNKEILRAVSQWREVINLYAYGEYNYSTSAWENNFVLGLKTDGTVLVCGDNTKIVNTVSQWSNIKKLFAESGAVIAVTGENTVLTAELYPYIVSEVSAWRDIADINFRDSFALGLKTDGSLISTVKFDTDISQWQNIVQIETNFSTIACLKADGTVVTAQEKCILSENKIKAAESWENIAFIQYFNDDLWGLTEDGTVISTGAYPPKNENIVQVAGDDGDAYGLTKDGAVVSFAFYILQEANEWQDIARLVFTGYDPALGNILLGIQKDGTVLAIDTILSNQKLPRWTKIK